MKAIEQSKPAPTGLSTAEATRLLSKHGTNELIAAQRTGSVIQIVRLFANPLVIILLIASLASFLLGERINASIIVLMVVLGVALNFFQTYRSQRAAEQLRQQVAPTASALRDGEWAEVPRRVLVPGDVIRLRAGDLVPADARLLEARDIHVNQASLTGESLPVEKEASLSPHAKPDSVEGRDVVFLGTSIVSGTATAIVVATGGSTAFGDIAARLAARPPETEFERGTRAFGLLIMKTVFFLVAFVFLVSAALHHNAFESLLFAIALAVGLTPEFLPMITTVTLGKGAVHMARQKVIVKHLEAIQNFGSMDVLCSDKTGTLTSGETVLDQHVDPLGNSAERVFLLAYLNSFFETGVENSLNKAILQKAGANPLDLAILHHDHPDIAGYQKLDEIPFDFERRRASIVVQVGGNRLLIVKGAPESVLAVCSEYELGARALSLDSAGRAQCEATYEAQSADGFRVLAVAHRTMPHQNRYTAADEHDLVLAGYVTFLDPPLEDAAEILESLRRDGVAVKILTGDNELVARHICSRVGLDAGSIVMGKELDRMTDAALAQVSEQATVFARVSPAQKNRIIIALKNRGHVVGFLGDGINDAPSLHAADVGISVSNAVDVAKDAAQIILLEHNLRVLHNGIIDGRKAFGNVMKYLLMGTSSNFGNMFSMAGASLFLKFLPMLPTQILLNNFLYDLAQVTIPTDNVDPSFIRKPRKWDIGIIRKFMLYIGPISSVYDFLTFFIMLRVFQAPESLFHTGWFVESLATQTLVLFVIRTGGNPLRSRPSMPLTITTLMVVIAGIVLPFSPLAGVLGFTPLPATYFLFLMGMTVSYLLLVEIVKRRLMRRLLD
ncbi:MAG TPA: magnesium-translocating P-type ATPase [Blastocatellia bacterium]|nr:magnesium-translocating P-type ATPase [Blastocatellia bacterium]